MVAPTFQRPDTNLPSSLYPAHFSLWQKEEKNIFKCHNAAEAVDNNGFQN
jgi:hypothetical protein